MGAFGYPCQDQTRLQIAKTRPVLDLCRFVQWMHADVTHGIGPMAVGFGTRQRLQHIKAPQQAVLHLSQKSRKKCFFLCHRCSATCSNQIALLCLQAWACHTLLGRGERQRSHSRAAAAPQQRVSENGRGQRQMALRGRQSKNCTTPRV